MKEFIFYGSSDEVINQMYSDLKLSEKIIYKTNIVSIDNHILKFLFKFTFSKRINQYIKVPFKKKWFSIFFSEISDSEFIETPYFIFTKNNFKFLELGYAKYLKTKLPNCKIILLFLDIHGLRGYNFNYLNSLYDEAYVFDSIEAKKYGISYYPLCYSRSRLENNKKIYDICFIGQDKGRSETLHKIYIKAKSMGLNAKIIICGKAYKQFKYDEFEYRKSISYKDALEIVSQSKFNLEICLEDTSSISIRLNEAIMFNQGLITNNGNIKNSPYYDKSFVHILDSNNINLNFVKQYKLIENENRKKAINPLRFIAYLKRKELEGGKYYVNF